MGNDGIRRVLDQMDEYRAAESVRDELRSAFGHMVGREIDCSERVLDVMCEISARAMRERVAAVGPWSHWPRLKPIDPRKL